jgi:hypothetical protein
MMLICHLPLICSSLLASIKQAVPWLAAALLLASLSSVADSKQQGRCALCAPGVYEELSILL